MANKAFTASLDFLPVSFRLIKAHFNAVLWLIYLPALLMGLGQLLVSQVVTGHHYAAETLTINTLASDIFEVHKGQLGIGLMSLGLIWSIVALPAIIGGTLRAAQGQAFDPIHALSDSRRYYWRLIGLTFLVAVTVEIGLLLFIVPGIIALRMLLLSPYYLVEKNLGVFQAFKLSARQSRLSPGPIYGVIGVLLWLFVGGTFLGIIPIIGVVLSLFVTYLYLFGPALRFVELNRLFPSDAKSTIARRRKTSGKEV